MKKNLTTGGIIVISLILIFASIVSITEMIQGFSKVESFCSIKYKYNVTEYKSCRELTPNQLVDKLIKEEINKNNINTPTISLIPIK